MRSSAVSMTSAARAVTACTSPIIRPIVTAAFSASPASLRTSSATTANPRPDSPARAASIAALSASRFVCSAIVVIVAAMPPMSLDFSSRPRIVSAATAEDSRTPRIASKTSLTARPPASAATRVRWAAATVSWASATPCWVAAATASVVARVEPVRCTCVSAPRATSATACAISATARPVCSDAPATSCEVPNTLAAPVATRPIASDSARARVVVGLHRGDGVEPDVVDGARHLAELVVAGMVDRLGHRHDLDGQVAARDRLQAERRAAVSRSASECSRPEIAATASRTETKKPTNRYSASSSSRATITASWVRARESLSTRAFSSASSIGVVFDLHRRDGRDAVALAALHRGLSRP